MYDSDMHIVVFAPTQKLKVFGGYMHSIALLKFVRANLAYDKLHIF
jgi:hypothetical protein